MIAQRGGDSMNSELHNQVIEAEERLRQAMLTNDVRVLDQLIADDLVFTGHLGQLATKAEDLAAHKARWLRVQKIEPSEQRIQLHANFAVVSVLMHLVGTYQDTPVDQHMRYTRVWAPTSGGSLQIVAGHMCEYKTG
jgi:ketosteroid isomerase-like protein